MPETFVVAFAVGVTPGKWARIWGERMPRHPLELRQLSPEAAMAALGEGAADVALLRLPVPETDVPGDELSAIPLYEESPVVVVPKDHAIEAVDSVTLGDLDGEPVIGGEWAEAIDVVASGVGVAIMPQSVARALARRDVIAKPLVGVDPTTVALVWLTAETTPEVDEFIGIVRGRTANSSRGALQDAPTPAGPASKQGPQKQGPQKQGTAKPGGQRSGRTARPPRRKPRSGR